MIVVISMLLVVGMMFWPVLTQTFGIHQDYALLGVATDPTIVSESNTWMIVGARFLGRIMVNWQGFWTGSIESLMWWRWVGFGLTVLAIGQLLRMLYHRGLGIKRLSCILLAVFSLPSIHAGIFWAVHVFPGAFNLLLAMVAHRLFDRSLQGWSLSPRAGAGLVLGVSVVLVFISLWIYFPTACAFLLMGYVKVLWPHEHEHVIKNWFRDCCFFILAMMIYMVIDRMVMYQWVVSTTAVVNVDPDFTVGLTRAPWQKLGMLADSFIVSWQGTWNVLGGCAVWLSMAEIVTLAAVLVTGGTRWVDYWMRLVMRVSAALVLFFLTQFPIFMSLGITHIKGYRVLIIPMLAFLLLKMWMVDGLLTSRSSRIGKVLLGAWMVLVALTCLTMIHSTVNHHRAELMALERAVLILRSHPEMTQVDILPAKLPKDMFNQRVLSEYHYTMDSKQQIQPAFNALCLKHEILASRYVLNVVEREPDALLSRNIVFINLQESLP